MSSDLLINPHILAEELIKFIRDKTNQTQFTRVIIGLSGGIDSAVSCTLAVRALSQSNVHVGIFPYGDLNNKGAQDALNLVNRLAVKPSNIHKIDIKPIVDSITNLDNSIDNIRRGNITARARMILLFDLAKKYSALVLGTENKTEHLLGYFTRFGDEASDIEPIRNLYKTQVRQLARYLKIPEVIINSSPTAGLWENQTDEGDFGFSYSDADKILYLLTEKNKSVKELMRKGFEIKLLMRVIDRMEKNSFKHILPYMVDK
jgi:NAD+ synthase